jgi:N-acetylneuraminic acid mutarotase
LRYNIPEGDWEWLEPFRNKNGLETERAEMVCFQIENRTYLGMGYGTDPGMGGTDVESQSDLYVYDPFEDQWKVRAIPVEVGEDINVRYLGRSGGISFAIGDKGYMGLGVQKRYKSETEEMEEQLLNDFWEFSVK